MKTIDCAAPPGTIPDGRAARARAADSSAPGEALRTVAFRAYSPSAQTCSFSTPLAKLDATFFMPVLSTWADTGAAAVAHTFLNRRPLPGGIVFRTAHGKFREIASLFRCRDAEFRFGMG